MTYKPAVEESEPVASHGPAQPYEQFVLFGDSITQQAGSQEKGFGFAPALQDAYIRKLDVVNRGLSGYTTKQGIIALPQFMPRVDQAKVRLMTVFFGANDATLPGTPTGQHVPLDQYCQLLKSIANHPSVQAHKPRLMLITPPPINEYQIEFANIAKGVNSLNRLAGTTKKYAEACKETAKELGVPVVDLWTAFMTAAGWKEGDPLLGSKDVERSLELEKLLSDGLHLNPDGYKIMYAEVMKVIRQSYSDQAPENLPMILPSWEVAPK